MKNKLLLILIGLGIIISGAILIYFLEIAKSGNLGLLPTFEIFSILTYVAAVAIGVALVALIAYRLKTKD